MEQQLTNYHIELYKLIFKALIFQNHVSMETLSVFTKMTHQFYFQLIKIFLIICRLKILIFTSGR